MTESRGEKTILIVDDEPNVAAYLETLLQDNGYATMTAGDGEEAMERVRETRPDLISLDITMPKQSGVGFYRDLREDAELKTIPVVIVTAVTGYAGDPEEFRKFISTRKSVPPPEGFLAKPIKKDELLELFGKLLA
jgi:CheY-like chemotaxis protein